MKRRKTNEKNMEEFQNRQEQSLYENRTSNSMCFIQFIIISIFLLGVLTRNDLLGGKRNGVNKRNIILVDVNR